MRQFAGECLTAAGLLLLSMLLLEESRVWDTAAAVGSLRWDDILYSWRIIPRHIQMVCVAFAAILAGVVFRER